jgi:hypothetical protein
LSFRGNSLSQREREKMLTEMNVAPNISCIFHDE